MNSLASRSFTRIGIGILVAGAGLAHFTHADFFRALIPEALGSYRGIINVATGILQTALGLTFLVPRLRAFARWSTIALLGLTLPAAVDQVVHPEVITSLGLTPTLAALRVLVQVLMIALVWWATKPNDQNQTKS